METVQTNETETTPIVPVEPIVVPVVTPEPITEVVESVEQPVVEIEDTSKADAKARGHKIHEWKVAICRGDFDVAKTLYKELELTATKVTKLSLHTPDVKSALAKIEKAAEVVEAVEVQTVKTKPIKPSGGKRGRKAREYPLPDGEFTVKSAMATWGVSQPQANNVINAALEAGTATKVRTEKIEGQRGKPSGVFAKVLIQATAEIVAPEPVAAEAVVA